MTTIAPAYPIAETVLGNGLRVVVSPDHNVPAVAVNLWYDVGSRHEEPGRTGLAHLFEHLMFQGSAHVPGGEHFARLHAVGAVANATTYFDRTNYFEVLPVGALDLALWLEADRMATLPQALTPAILAKEREVVKEEKRQNVDNAPYGDALQRQLTMLFAADHPYGHETIGSMADLDAADLSDVKAFFERHYLPNNAVLTIVGDVEVDDAFARAERYFGNVAQGVLAHPPAQPTLSPLPLTAPRRDEVIADVPELQLHLGWRLPPAGTAEFDAVKIALAVLGQGEGARAVRRLTRDARIARSVSAFTVDLVGGNALGFVIATPHDDTDLAVLEQELLEEVGTLAKSPPTAAEMRRARALFELEWLSALADLGTRADLISESTLLHHDPDRINTRITDFAAVDAHMVQAAAATWLAPDTHAALTYQPRSTR